MAQLKPYKGGYYIWHYVPSQAAGIVFAVAFALLTAAAMWRMFQTRTWYCSVFAIGGLFEVIGFIGRFLAHDNTDRLLPFILQNSFILLAPALFAASIYIVLGRIIRRVKGEPYSLVPARWLTRMFVSGDVLSFAVQGSAAGLMATGDNAQLGENIVVAGLFIQIVVFGFFVVTAGVFQVRMQRRPTVEAEDPASLWREDLGMLYTASGLIMVRSIFRVVEFIMGYDGYLLRHEWTLYVFDAVLMLLVMVVFLLRYPGRAINPDLKSGFMCLREL